MMNENITCEELTVPDNIVFDCHFFVYSVHFFILTSNMNKILFLNMIYVFLQY